MNLPIDDDREWVQWWIEDEEYQEWLDRWCRENEFKFYPKQRELLERPVGFFIFGGVNRSSLDRLF